MERSSVYVRKIIDFTEIYGNNRDGVRTQNGGLPLRQR